LIRSAPAGRRRRQDASRPAGRTSRTVAGASLTEVLAIVALLGILAGLGSGPLLAALGRVRLRSAAAELAARMRAARHAAVTRACSVGLRFEPENGGWRVAHYRDGDGDGMRSDDIARGVDRPFGIPYRPGDGRGGIRFGIPAGRVFPRIPPSRGSLQSDDDPIQFGSSNIASFSPLGDATSGTAYLTDEESRLAAVVVFGATSRVRILLFDPVTGEWRE